MIARSWDGVRNLLCVRLDTIGDVLMTAPAMRALRQSLDGPKLTLLTSPAGAGVARLIPEVDDVLVYRAPWMKGHPAHEGLYDLSMVEELRLRDFDAAVVFTTFSQSPLPAAMLCYLAGIPRRLAACHENPYQLLTDYMPDLEPDRLTRHEVQRQLDLVAHAGCTTDDSRLSLDVPPAAVSDVRALMEAEGIDLARPWVLIHPGSTAPSRRYPVEAFAAVAQTLQQQHGWQVVLSGDASERALVEKVRQTSAARPVSLAGKTSLPELVALVSLAPLLISNNTAPVHIAAAVGTPVVDLYAMTNPQHTPWRVPNRVLMRVVPCGYCYKSVCPEGHHACLRDIDPREVVDAAVELYEITSGKEAARAGA
jgi:lipopolysaccharide heptosyltransferase II